MDPNATLRMFHDACSNWHQAVAADDVARQAEERAEALDALSYLRGWIMKGGVLPTFSK